MYKVLRGVIIKFFCIKNNDEKALAHENFFISLSNEKKRV